MAVNKVIYDGTTLVDLTGNTVTADTMLAGVTATDRSGESITGTYVDEDTTYTLTKSGNTITLTGSDGSTTSVTDSNTTYSAMTQTQATAGTSTSGLRISPKVLHDTIQNSLPTVPDALSELTNDMTVSDFTNDAGYITGYTETDPTVPSWAKASSKPSYTASEVGALPDTTVIPSKVSDLTNDSGYITASAIPTNVSAFTNDSGYLTSYTETGNIEFDTSASTGTTDGDLYALLTDWGWTDCIV